MKYLLIFLMIFAMVFSTGCFVVPEEPEEPIPVLSIEVVVLGSYICGDHQHIPYSVENDGDVGVDYELEFVVGFDGHQDRTFIVESDGPLKVGDKVDKNLMVQCGDCGNLGDYPIDSVNVTYELWG